MARLAVGVRIARMVERIHVPVDDAFVAEGTFARPVSLFGVARRTTAENTVCEIPTFCGVAGRAGIGIVTVGHVIVVTRRTGRHAIVAETHLRPGFVNVARRTFTGVMASDGRFTGVTILAQPGTAVIVRDLLPTVARMARHTLAVVVPGRKIAAVAIHTIVVVPVPEIRVTPATGGVTTAARTRVVRCRLCTAMALLTTGQPTVVEPYVPPTWMWCGNWNTASSSARRVCGTMRSPRTRCDRT